MTDETLLGELSQVEGALSASVAGTSTRDLESRVGRDHATLHRWGDDITRWRGSDLLRMAKRSPMLAKAIVDYLGGSAAYSADSAEAQALAVTGDMGGDIAEIAGALADGRLDPLERQALSERLGSRVEQLSRLHASLNRRTSQSARD